MTITAGYVAPSSAIAHGKISEPEDTESKDSAALSRTVNSRALLAATSPLLLGHRGGRAETVENMPAALVHACNLQNRGLAGIEFDVQLSADGHLIIFHDETLLRLGKQQARIDQMTLAEIRRIRIFNESIMALDDLLTYPLAPVSLANRTLLKGQSKANAQLATPRPATLYNAMMGFNHIELEIKTHERTNYTMLVRALEDSLIRGGIAKLPLVLTSFDVTLLNMLYRHPILSKIPRGLLSETPEMIAQLTHTATRLACRQVGVHYPLIDATLVKQCRRAELTISAWTVNDRDEANKLHHLGVDVLITDHPRAFLEFM